MNRREYHIGPGAALLMLVVVVLCLSVLGLLTFMSARSDSDMAERAESMNELNYETYAAAERVYAELDAVCAEKRESASDDAGYLKAIEEALTGDMDMTGDTITWVQNAGGGRELECAVQVMPLSGEQRLKWLTHSLTADEGDTVSFDD